MSRVEAMAGSLALLLFTLPTPALDGQPLVPRIINGVESDEFESVGIVGSRRFGGFCTGTLISPFHVLTAAHCAEVIGGPTTGTFEVAGAVYATSRIFIHPRFNSRTLANDIAILELSEPVLDVLPSSIFRGTPREDDVLTIVGFGAGGTAASGGDGSFGIKMAGIVGIDDVTETLIIWVFDDVSESNTAAGDSGGPGMLEVDGEFYVASITSAGTEPDAGLGDIAVNSRVDAYASWIDAVVEAVNDEETDQDDGNEPEDEQDGQSDQDVDGESDSDPEDIGDQDTQGDGEPIDGEPIDGEQADGDNDEQDIVSCPPAQDARPHRYHRRGHRSRQANGRPTPTRIASSTRQDGRNVAPQVDRNQRADSGRGAYVTTANTRVRLGGSRQRSARYRRR